MGTKERDIINEVLRNMPENQRLFRINAGMGWAGRAVKHGNITVIKNAFPFHGAPEGWPDICGFESKTITPDMVGEKIAIFKGIEIKATGKLSPKQLHFKEMILRMGGIFEVITS